MGAQPIFDVVAVQPVHVIRSNGSALGNSSRLRRLPTTGVFS